ncbi:MAG TPA: MFS transporter [Woeseiaceae bacterium]|nr:MFS transporter [Woeseiaceae bacterium]
MTTIESPTIKNSHTVAPDGLVARTFLSFLATAGLFYANIMPAIVDGLIQALGFTPQDAGFVGSANVYGAAVGALLIVFLIKRLRWRTTAYVLIGALISMDLLSMLVTSPQPLIAMRFVHGVVGGALVGTAFSVIARTVSPDRTFGVLLVVQFGLGGLGNMYLPRLVPMFGVDVLFMALIAFSVVTALMIPLLDEYRVQPPTAAQLNSKTEKIRVVPLALALISVFLFQAGNMGLFAFVIGLGRAYALELDFITLTLAASAWVGIVGAVAVVVLHTRFGRLRPLVIAMLLTTVGILALHYSANATLFFIANCGMGITWAFIIPYLLGLCAEFDKSGQMAALGGFASKMGLASGPLVAGLLLGDDNYGLLINISAVVLFVSMLACIVPAIYQDKAVAN